MMSPNEELLTLKKMVADLNRNLRETSWSFGLPGKYKEYYVFYDVKPGTFRLIERKGTDAVNILNNAKYNKILNTIYEINTHLISVNSREDLEKDLTWLDKGSELGRMKSIWR